MRKVRLIHANERPKPFGEQASPERRMEAQKFRESLAMKYPEANAFRKRETTA